MASKYEAEVYRCMDPTLELYERTTKPLHRAILPSRGRGEVRGDHRGHRSRRGDDPGRVREIHKQCLAGMEAKMGRGYWVNRG